MSEWFRVDRQQGNYRQAKEWLRQNGYALIETYVMHGDIVIEAQRNSAA
jgi:hypothetical protein